MTRTEEVAFFLLEKVEEDDFELLTALRQATAAEAESVIDLAGFSNNEDTIEVIVSGSVDKKLKVISVRKNDFIMKFKLNNKQFRQLHASL